uniref:HNH endonuclease n=1 Tax=Prevotella sp. TaxID=59823 RepID=UPI0040286F04
MIATITYRPNAQKTPGLFDAILTDAILTDICQKVTGQNKYRIVKDKSTYNKGRLVYVEYEGVIYYISLSEVSIEGRNSSLQSVPSAINLFYADTRLNKQLCYYFMPHNGNAFTDYHLFIYKLLMTAGVRFLNIEQYYHQPITAYNNVDDLIIDRRDNQGGNSSNNSSYVSKSSDAIQIYAKTFGASKYESTLMAIAISHIADRPVELYNICEQDLKKLPQASINTIESLGNISLYYTTLFLDKHQPADESERAKLRSASYLYNLYNRIGYKRCALCNCEISEIIQGAHIWGVSQISHSNNLSDEEKFAHAINGNNGLWLCQNHHKLFDSNIIMIDDNGHIRIKDGLVAKDMAFIRSVTFKTSIDEAILTDDFRWYISKRNEELDILHSQELVV